MAREGLRRQTTSSRKSRRKISPLRPEWEMLAYLDYSLKYRPDHRRFKQHIVGHLRENTKVSWRWKTIEKRIRRLWDTKCIPRFRTCDYESIYHHGTKVLSFGQDDTDIKDRLKRRVEEIVKETAEKRLEEPERASRSKPLGSHISLGDEFPIPDYQRAVRSTVPRTPVQQPLDGSIQAEGDQGTGHSSGEIFHDAQEERASPAPSVIADSEESQTPSSHTFSSNSIDDDTLSLTVEDNVLKQHAEASGADHGSLKLLPSSNETFAMDTVMKISQELQMSQALRKEFSELREQARFFHEQWKMSQELIKNLTDESLSRADTIEMLNNLSQVHIGTSLERYRTQISRLTTKLRERTLLKELVDAKRKYPLGPLPKEMEELLNFIETDNLKLWASSEIMSTSCCMVELEEANEDLIYLYGKAFGDSKVKLPCESILRSLTSVAVGDWVLMKDFDEPYLAKSYRGEAILKQLEAQVGEELALNVDLAALTTLIESDYCKMDLLPRRASAFAERLSTALAPLMPFQSRSSDSPNTALERRETQKKKLQNLFEKVLQMKLKMLVSEWKYEVILPRLGDNYDENLMRKEGVSSPTSLVQAVLAPGLRRYMQEAIHAYKIENGEDNMDIGYKSLRSFASDPQHSCDWIGKAVVRLE